MMGSVDWHIMGSLLAGSLPGIFVGSYFAIRIPERALRLVLATTLFVVASRIAYDHANCSFIDFYRILGACSPLMRAARFSDLVDQKTAIPEGPESILPPARQRQ